MKITNYIINKTIRKKTIYILCFMALCYIDFLRNTQNGDIWKAASNCTGLVLAVIVFSGYPLKVFRSVFSYVWIAVWLCVAGYAAVFGEYFIYRDVYKWTFVFAVLNILWLGVYAGYFIKAVLREKTWGIKPGLLGWFWIALSACMTFNVSGRLWPAWFFLMFGAFYITKYKEKDFIDMADALVDGTIAAFFILQIYCYAFRPYDEVRYKGAYPNCNVASLHYLWVYVCVLTKLHFLHKKKAGKGWKLFYFLGAAGMLDFMIMTMSRSSWLASIALTGVFGVCVVMKNWGKRWWDAVGRGAVLLGATILLFPVTFATVRWLPTIHPHPVWHGGEYHEGRIHSWDPPDAPQYIELDEFLEELLRRLGGTLQLSHGNPLVLKVQAAGSAEPEYEYVEPVNISFLDDAMNGRLAIYKAYIENMTLFGNPESAGHYWIGDEEHKFESWHAQNLWIQVGYSYGIPAGVILIVMTVLLIKHKNRQLRDNPDNIYAVIPLLVCVMFFTFALTELDWNVGQYPLFLLFFVQHPQFGDRLENFWKRERKS